MGLLVFSIRRNVDELFPREWKPRGAGVGVGVGVAGNNVSKEPLIYSFKKRTLAAAIGSDITSEQRASCIISRFNYLRATRAQAPRL